MNRVASLLALLLALSSSSLHAQVLEQWSQWRGPRFNGSADAANLPTSWSTTENVVWATPLPGPGAATPSVAGDRIFLTAFSAEDSMLLAIAVDRQSGKVLWQRPNGPGRESRQRGYENMFAECSPAADAGLGVACFMFGNGRLAGYNFDGDELWARDLAAEFGKLKIDWGYASSPLLWGGRLYVQVIRTGESYILAVEPKTGETIWRHIREDDARSESEQAYTSPVPFVNGDREEILILGADCLTSHDPATGKEFWRWSGLNPRQARNYRAITNTLVGSDGFIYVTEPQNNALHALQVKGDEVSEVWTLDRPTPDVMTPLLYKDRLYVSDGKRRRKMVCLNPATGERLWESELDTHAFIRASATAGDDKIYLIDAEGFCVVLEAGDAYKVIATSELDSYPCRSNIVIDNNQLLIRTADRLYCIGNVPAEEPRTQP
ncbi:MAG: PQQ-binding-like beta-propeller repeat protein [Phycisphaerales bacterium]|nr:PQQ-binding-like beta-propeller repeat protein [Phycisphaerales bacterium]